MQGLLSWPIQRQLSSGIISSAVSSKIGLRKSHHGLLSVRRFLSGPPDHEQRGFQFHGHQDDSNVLYCLHYSSYVLSLCPRRGGEDDRVFELVKVRWQRDRTFNSNFCFGLLQPFDTIHLHFGTHPRFLVGLFLTSVKTLKRLESENDFVHPPDSMTPLSILFDLSQGKFFADESSFNYITGCLSPLKKHGIG